MSRNLTTSRPPHTVDFCFGGLDESITNLEKAHAVILPVPYDGTMSYMIGRPPRARARSSRRRSRWSCTTRSSARSTSTASTRCPTSRSVADAEGDGRPRRGGRDWGLDHDKMRDHARRRALAHVRPGARLREEVQEPLGAPVRRARRPAQRVPRHAATATPASCGACARSCPPCRSASARSPRRRPSSSREKKWPVFSARKTRVDEGRLLEDRRRADRRRVHHGRPRLLRPGDVPGRRHARAGRPRLVRADRDRRARSRGSAASSASTSWS